MRLLNTLYVRDHQTRVAVHHGALTVTRSGQPAVKVPTETLDAVILLGRAQITTEAISQCAAKGIRIGALRRNGQVNLTIAPPQRGNVLLRVAQTRIADDPARAVPLARAIVAGKIQNCRRLLTRWANDSPSTQSDSIERQVDVLAARLERLPTLHDLDTIRGIEGDAARAYFKALGIHVSRADACFAFPVRSRRPPLDATNCLLGYLYSLLTLEAAGALEAVGLDPQIGFLHGLRSGRPALALDLVEEFRPALADRFAVSLITRHQVRPEHFQVTTGGAWYLTDEGRHTVLELWETYRDQEVPHLLLDRRAPRWALATLQATLLARHLRGDLPAYPPFVMER